MAVDFKSSETKENLMRAFAGESQARNRYTFAAAQAKEQKLQVKDILSGWSWRPSLIRSSNKFWEKRRGIAKPSH